MDFLNGTKMKTASIGILGNNWNPIKDHANYNHHLKSCVPRIQMVKFLTDRLGFELNLNHGQKYHGLK
jgi:hypothetical protein